MLKPYFFIIPVLLFFSFQVKTFGQSSSPFATLDSIHHVCDSVGGYVKFSLNGDPQLYTWYWQHGPVELELDSLSPGDYTFVVIDFYGCVETYDITIEDLNGCQMTFALFYALVDCVGLLSIKVFNSANGQPIDETSLIVKWSDNNPSGLNRLVSLKEDSTYCVHIEMVGGDTASCCEIDTCIFVPKEIRCRHAYLGPELIVNEFNRQAEGDGQYVELLVVGNGICGETFDLRGYRLDDNNGYLIPGKPFISDYNSALIGVDPGFLSFSFHDSWAAVPNGSLIVIYDDTQNKHGRIPPDDPTDSDGNGVYVLSADAAPYLLGMKSAWNPDNLQWGYQGSIQAPGWNLVRISSPQDGMQTRRPDGAFSHGQSLGNSAYAAANPFPLWITPNSSTSANCQFLESDPMNKLHFSCFAAEDSLQSPGIPNSFQNSVFIDSLRHCPQERLLAGMRDNTDHPAQLRYTQRQRQRQSQSQIKAFPNPFKKELFLELNSAESGELSLRVFSPSGQLILQQTTSCPKGPVNVQLFESQRLGPGLHLMECQFPDGTREYIRVVKIEL